MDKEGRIRRDGKLCIVEVPWSKKVSEKSGVESVRIKDVRVCRKIFREKPVYLPDQFRRAELMHLVGRNVILLAVNGYSVLSDIDCGIWGVQPGSYEAAVYALVRKQIISMMDEFSGADPRLLHGASNIGVDKVSIRVARDLNRPQFGFSCPRFMFDVEDDDVPVYVSPTQASYAESFAKTAHILLACNGRAQALHQDLLTALLYGREVIPVNVLRKISTNGGPPAIGPDGKINDAVDAFERRVHFVGRRYGTSSVRDAWKDMVQDVTETVTGICRQVLSPESAFVVR